MDKHALDVMNHESFLRLSAAALSEMISRDSFFASEIDIFLAVKRWVNTNPEADAEKVLSNVNCMIETFVFFYAEVASRVKCSHV